MIFDVVKGLKSRAFNLSLNGVEMKAETALYPHLVAIKS